MTIYKKYGFHALSLAWHAAILLLMVVSVYSVTEVQQIGNTDQVAVNSYVLDASQVQAIMQAVKPSSTSSQSEMQPPLVTKRAEVISTRVRQQQPHNSSASVSEQQAVSSQSAAGRHTGVSTETLLALLHAAIQQKQRYPVSAMQMERVGRTTVAFMLMPTGMVQQLRMVRSSGTDSLDEAALSAVRDAAPFAQVQAYLDGPREFSIDVVFE